MAPWYRLALALVLGAACSSPHQDDLDDEGADGKEDRTGGPTFREVDPGHTSAAFRRYIQGGLELLAAHDSEIARLTARAIRDGRVLVDELADLTCWDFERARLELGHLELHASDYVRLREPGGTVAARLAGEIDGYMWSNRIYVSRGLDRRRLAATLVHEVNHVINRSEVGYFDDLPTSAFLHEYRAFHAERLVDPGAYEGIDLTAHVTELYGLDPALIPPGILAEPLSPLLLPDAAAWRERRVEDDPADDEEACPGWH
jgi:hypothetical protein